MKLNMKLDSSKRKEAYKRECKSAYVRTRLLAFRYVGYSIVEVKDSIATLKGSGVEPRAAYFLELPEGEHKIGDILNAAKEDL